MKYLQQLCLKFLYKLFCHPTLSFPPKQKLEGYFNTSDSSPFLRNKVLMKSLCAWLKSAPSLVLFILCPPCGLHTHFNTLAPLGKLVGESVCLPRVSVEATQADPRGWTRTERRGKQEIGSQEHTNRKHDDGMRSAGMDSTSVPPLGQLWPQPQHPLKDPPSLQLLF